MTNQAALDTRHRTGNWADFLTAFAINLVGEKMRFHFEGSLGRCRNAFLVSNAIEVLAVVATGTSVVVGAQSASLRGEASAGVITNARAPEPDHFSLYRYPADGFEAAFPSKPLEFQTSKDPEFGHVSSYQAFVVNALSQYSVFVNHSPKNLLFEDASIDAYLEETVRGLMVGSKNAVLKSKRRLQFIGFPALEYQYAHTLEGVPMMLRGVVFVVDRDHIRLSQLYVPKRPRRRHQLSAIHQLVPACADRWCVE